MDQKEGMKDKYIKFFEQSGYSVYINEYDRESGWLNLLLTRKNWTRNIDTNTTDHMSGFSEYIDISKNGSGDWTQTRFTRKMKKLWTEYYMNEPLPPLEILEGMGLG